MPGISKTKKIAKILEERIAAGIYADKLPSDEQLSREFGIARMTAAGALKQLVADGSAVRVPFKGTFLKPRRERIIRVLAGRRFTEKLAVWTEKRFPGVHIERVAEHDAADLAVLTTFSPLDYAEELVPIPRDKIAELEKSGRFFSCIFPTHRRGRDIYALPAFFSPILFAYDPVLMRNLAPDFDPYGLSWDDLLAFRKQTDSILSLKDACDVWFYTLLQSVSDHFDIDACQQAFALFRELPFTRENGLFTIITRHGAAIRSRKTAEKFDIAPMPLIRGRRVAGLASEALAVFRHADDHDFLMEICLSTLEPECQRLFTEEQYGIPLDRACAVDTFTGHSFRDDIFFTEINHLSTECQTVPFSVRREVRLSFSEGLPLGAVEEKVLAAARQAAFDAERNQHLYQSGEYCA